ncbi:hypothetical protein HELRODRAFT_182688 [Helobdella robusta]|uniref:Reverse transcriptase domain-containing protein n=1 Tax=Helobdella robusta TaxID=6412 RepID=T1FIL2_HELRO|nr:hypothetical protein HELRODRAFT_182688 [Helobdella robusta]ESN90197.1 hypothetical protein HELRODRAFT_182688 [Helobdella robusta]
MKRITYKGSASAALHGKRLLNRGILGNFRDWRIQKTRKEGLAVIRDLEGTVSRWAEHFSDLLNCINQVDPTFIETLLELSVVAELHSPPPLDEAKSKVSHDKIFEFQYADGAAFPANTISALQNSLNVLSSACSRAGLVVNNAKTEILSITTNQNKPVTFIVVHGDALNDSQELMHLGSMLCTDCCLDREIVHRIRVASAAFGRLRSRVFLNYNLTVMTKIFVYKVVCIFALLYRFEFWAHCRRHIKALRPSMFAIIAAFLE